MGVYGAGLGDRDLTRYGRRPGGGWIWMREAFRGWMDWERGAWESCIRKTFARRGEPWGKKRREEKEDVGVVY